MTRNRYARQLFIKGGASGSRGAFANLGNARAAPEIRNRLFYPILGERFTGSITRIEAGHAFIIRDGMADSVFLHASNVPPGKWKHMVISSRIGFAIAFTFRGPSAFEVEILERAAASPEQFDLLWEAERPNPVPMA
jgi:cold shock CspA family protein